MEASEKIIVNVTPGGPYVIKGEIKLVLADGSEKIITGVNALCRCGHSKTKPFCDGTHKTIKFE